MKRKAELELKEKIQKKPKKEDIEDQKVQLPSLTDKINNCLEADLSPILSSFRVSNSFGMENQSIINERNLKIGNFQSRVNYFFPRSLWLLLNNILNKKMNSKLTDPIKVIKSTRIHHSPLPLKQTPLFLQLLLQIDNNTSDKLSTNIEVFDFIRKQERTRKSEITISKNRFKALRSSFIPTHEDLVSFVDIIRDIWRKAILPGSIVTFDETIFEFQPSRKVKEEAEKNRDAIPVVFMKGKPHPNGLLCYFFGTKMTNTKLPYMFDLQPHISIPQIAPQAALIKSIDRWDYHYKSHIVADSAFGSIKVTDHILEWGGVSTLSINRKVETDIWDLLQWNTMQDQCRALYNSRHIFSLVAREDDHVKYDKINNSNDEEGKEVKKKTKLLKQSRILTTGFKVNNNGNTKTTTTTLPTTTTIPTTPETPTTPDITQNISTDNKVNDNVPTKNRNKIQNNKNNKKTEKRKKNKSNNEDDLSYDDELELKKLQKYGGMEDNDIMIDSNSSVNSNKNRKVDRNKEKNNNVINNRNIEKNEDKDNKNNSNNNNTDKNVLTGKPTEEFLKTMNVDQLVKYAGSNGLRRKRRTKQELIDYILRELNPSDERKELVRSFQADLKDNLTQDTVHSFYRAHFNTIDLFNRLLYEFDDKHKIIDWRSKLCICLIRSTIVNLYTVENEFERKSWKQFYADFLDALEYIRL
jgi:hypothetical protein